MDKIKKKKGETKKTDISFFHPDLLEVPDDGSPPFLKGYQCRACGQLDFPMQTLCPNCWGDAFEMVPLSRQGKLYSYADIYIGQAGLKTPYVIGYVDLPEDIRIFSMLEGQVGSFECEQDLELTTGPIRMNRDGFPVLSYKFKKASI
jgi:benzoylsuccinyl-CoA thiolase BbsA subunit